MRVRDIPSKLTDIIFAFDIDSDKMIGYQIVPRIKAKNEVLFRVFYRDGESIDYLIVVEDGLAYNLTCKDFRDSDALEEFHKEHFPWYKCNREEVWRDYLYYKKFRGGLEL